MLDVWIADCLLLLAIPTFMLFAVQRMRPRLLLGDGIRFEEPVTLQAEYQTRYIRRFWLLRIAPAALAIYFVLRILLWPPNAKADGPGVISLILAAFVIYVASAIGTVVLRLRQERAFVKAHPIFEDSLLPVRPRIVAILPLFLSLGALLSSLLVQDQGTVFTLMGLGFVGAVMSFKLRIRQITHSRYELPWDEPLGNSIADVVERFGRKPKKLVLYPSLLANAGALPDGSVFVTSALRTLATPSEVAAVVAHELSHVRDGEGKKWTRFRLIVTAPLGALAGYCVAVGQGSPIEAFIPPAVGFGLMTLSMIPAWLLGRRTRPAEFKCDADAATLGLGPDLASCLTKITQFMGQPSTWIGIDRHLLTHPSLEERIARLLTNP